MTTEKKVENEKAQVTYETQHMSMHPAALGIGIKNTTSDHKSHCRKS